MDKLLLDVEDNIFMRLLQLLQLLLRLTLWDQTKSITPQ